MARGGRREGAGRRKGVPNKLTMEAKEAIAHAFEDLGGKDGLVTWVKESGENRKVFYAQIWPKIVPLQVAGGGDNGEHLHEVTWRVVQPTD